MVYEMAPLIQRVLRQNDVSIVMDLYRWVLY
jgi:hypothetical protein